MLTFLDLLRGLPGCDNAVAVNLSSTDQALSPASRRIYVGVSGDVTVDTVGGQAGVTFKNVPVGYLDVRATKIYKTGTSADKLVALY